MTVPFPVVDDDAVDDGDHVAGVYGHRVLVPDRQIPVLADTDLLLYDWIGVSSYPVLNLANSEMVLEVYTDGGPWEVLQVIGEMLQE